jgi:hypothetical protein
MLSKEHLKEIIREMMDEYKSKDTKDSKPSLPNLFHGYDARKDKHDKKKRVVPEPNLEEGLFSKAGEGGEEEAVATIRKLQKKAKKYKELAYRRSLDDREKDAQQARQTAAQFTAKAQELAKQHKIVIEENNLEEPAVEESCKKKA